VIVVEVKAVQSFIPVHHAQVIAYLKQTGCPVGRLVNFNVTLLKTRHTEGRPARLIPEEVSRFSRSLV